MFLFVSSVKMKTEKTPLPAVEEPGWTFLTNHAHVLICLAEQPGLILREVADLVGITERAVQKIVADLETAGLLTRERDGRRNTYTLNTRRPLRHDIESHCTVDGLIRFVLDSKAAKARKPRA